MEASAGSLAPALTNQIKISGHGTQHGGKKDPWVPVLCSQAEGKPSAMKKGYKFNQFPKQKQMRKNRFEDGRRMAGSGEDPVYQQVTVRKEQNGGNLRKL